MPGEWWVLCGYTDAARSLNGYKVRAAAPFESPPNDDEIVWVDLDLEWRKHPASALGVRVVVAVVSHPGRLCQQRLGLLVYRTPVCDVR